MVTIDLIYALLIVIMSLYILLECISVAAETEHPKICIVGRYVFSAMSALFSIYLSFSYQIYPEVIAPIINKDVEPRHIRIELIVMIAAIFLSCWSRMVHRIFGDRRQRVTCENCEKVTTNE